MEEKLKKLIKKTVQITDNSGQITYGQFLGYEYTNEECIIKYMHGVSALTIKVRSESQIKEIQMNAFKQ